MRLKALAAVFAISVASPTVAQAASLDFFVVGSRSGGSVVQFRDGDVLESGALFRIHIAPRSELPIMVTLISRGQETTELAHIPRPIPPQEIILPGGGDWYELDDEAGIETILIKASSNAGVEKLEKFRIHHVDRIAIANLSAELARPRGELDHSQNSAESTIGRIHSLPNTDTRTSFATAFEGLGGFQQRDSFVTTRGATGVALYRRLSPGVVFVLATDGEDDFFGSGALISEFGEIVTNWHVVKGVDEVEVALKPPFGSSIDTADWYVADVIRFDAVLDLALIQIRQPPDGLIPIVLGNISAVEIGSDVHAIGHPEGLDWSYTQGVVSQYRRKYDWTYDDGSEHRANVIQTQTPINPGNSGGPLFNDAGLMIGINTFGGTESVGLNFAVAIDEVSSFLTEGQMRESRTHQVSLLAAVILASSDENGDGEPDKFRIDSNDNGVIDIVALDRDFDELIDVVVFDQNEDGKLDAVGIDSDGDGRIDFYKFDTNQDGVPDYLGYDYDQDGRIDRYSQ